MILALILIPLAATVVAWVVRKAPMVAALVSAAACFGAAYLAIVAQPFQAVVIMGRTLDLAPRAAVQWALCAVLLGLLFVGYAHSLRDELAWPLALGALALWAAALMARSPTIAALLLMAGAIVATLLTLRLDRETSEAASRGLTLIMIGSAAVMVAVWSAEIQGSDQGDLLLSDAAALALAFGLAILLGQFPFFVWLPPIYDRASPIAATMLGVGLSTTALIRFGQIQLWASPLAQLLLSNVLMPVGVTTCLAGCIGAAVQRRVGRILAYAAMADLGIVVLGLALRRPGSVETALLHLAYRNVAVVLVALAASVLRRSFGADAREALLGAARRAPLAIIGLTVGGFSLAGLPPLGGFASRFDLYRLLVTDLPVWTAIIALASMGPAWALARVVVTALTAAPLPGSRREPLVPGGVMLLLSATLLVAGLAPQWLMMVGGRWLDLLLQASSAAGG